MYKYLKLEVADHIATVTLDRPPVNALNRELVAEISLVSDAVEAAVAAGEARVAIITAAGKLFCAGADLKERMGMLEAEVEPTVRNLRACVNKFATLSIPTIAALQGSAFGGGFELALAADMRVLAAGIQVGLRETALAIIPGAGGTQRLSRLIGPANAMLWITTAGLFSAEEAVRQGAANMVVPAPELMGKTLDLARAIAANGPLAVRQAKRAVLAAFDKPLAEGLDFEFECYKQIIPTRDRVEGLVSFREKRPPKYGGK